MTCNFAKWRFVLNVSLIRKPQCCMKINPFLICYLFTFKCYFFISHFNNFPVKKLKSLWMFFFQPEFQNSRIQICFFKYDFPVSLTNNIVFQLIGSRLVLRLEWNCCPCLLGANVWIWGWKVVY